MIILILLQSCREEISRPVLNAKESTALDVYLSDYVSEKYKWGYLNKMGQLVIKNQFDDCRDFSEGLAAVNINGLWGYINNMGEIVVEPRFRAVYQFHEGLGLVYTFDGQYLFLDKDGTRAIDTLPYDEVHSFNSGRARVGSSRSYGYIDKFGKLVIPMRFDKAKNFAKGYATVSEAALKNVIDTTGRVVFKSATSKDKVYGIKDGMLRFKQNKLYGFYNIETREVIKPQYKRATDFENETAAVFDGYKWGLVDKAGKVTLLPYTQIKEGGEGKWIYRTDIKYGYLKDDGTQLTMPNFDIATRYSDGMAGVEVNGLWGYVDSLGSLAIAPKFPLVWDFKEGRARMINQDGFGFIDSQGEYLIPPYYLEVRDFNEGLARVQIFRQ